MKTNQPKKNRKWGWTKNHKKKGSFWMKNEIEKDGWWKKREISMKWSKRKKRVVVEITISWLVQENGHGQSERDRKFHQHKHEQVYRFCQLQCDLVHSWSLYLLLLNSMFRVKTELQNKVTHFSSFVLFIFFSLFYSLILSFCINERKHRLKLNELLIKL